VRAPVAQWQSAGIVSRGSVVRLHPGGSILLSLAFLLLPLSSFAAEPTPQPPLTYRLDTWTLVHVGGTEAKAPIFGARASAVLKVGRFIAGTWYQASATRDGVDVDNPATYESLEVYVLGAVDVVGPFALAGVSGYTRPSIGETGTDQRTWLAGALVGDGRGDRWALLGVGEHEAAGTGTRFLATWHLRIRDRTAFVGDYVGGSATTRRLRLGVAVQVWGDR
jgi:hypothetical protein